MFILTRKLLENWEPQDFFIVYKLKEIDDEYGLILPGMAVLDIGAAPGGWSQVIAEKLKLARVWNWYISEGFKNGEQIKKP